MGSVNCYLVRTASGFVLIDTGPATQRPALEKELAAAGCTPGHLDLIVLTHGDFDHTGSAAYLAETFRAPVALHRHDAGMVTQGDMFWNRSSGNVVIRALAPLLFRFSRENRFEPDLTLEEGDDLADFGLQARVLAFPGHSKGSIGILTGNGDLFCGDLLENTGDAPAPGSIVDNPAELDASLAKLGELRVNTVYPGHGPPFPMKAFWDRGGTSR